MSYRRIARIKINKALGRVGFELIRIDGVFQDYIPLQKTLNDAEASGLSVGDYIDLTFNVPGATQHTIDKMAELGVFQDKIKRVCEIGPGSGRYLEKIINICNPDYYEIYETAKEWRSWLKKTYKVTAHIPDGNSLSFTPTGSIDLIHTHKVLYGNPILSICKYFEEMVRVVSDNGIVVFDIVTEDCLNSEILNNWLESGVTHACSMTGKDFAIRFFTERGLSFVGSFFIPMSPGITEYFVFKK